MISKYKSLQNKNDKYYSSYSNINQICSFNKNKFESLNSIKSSTLNSIEKKLSFKDNKTNFTDNAKNQFIHYVPNNNSNINSLTNNNNHKLINIRSMPSDPCEPIKFKHRRMQKEPEPPVPVLRSPPKKLSAKTVRKWNVPPCMSNYKNQKGYTVPIEMRIMSDMRNNKDLKLSENFAKISDIINICEKESKLRIEERAKAKNSINLVNALKKEQELLIAAEAVRKQKLYNNLNSTVENSVIHDNKSTNNSNNCSIKNLNNSNIDLNSTYSKNVNNAVVLNNNLHINKKDNFISNKLLNRKRSIEEVDFSVDKNKTNKLDQDVEDRNKLRAIIKKEVNKTKYKNDKNYLDLGNKKRDISEIIALGYTTGQNNKIDIIDSRLYNQTSGIDHGFKDDEEYDLYDKPLFSSKNNLVKNFKNNNKYNDLDEEELKEYILGVSRDFEKNNV